MPYKHPEDMRANAKKIYYSERGREMRALRHERILEQHKRYRRSEKGKMAFARKAKRMRLKYPEKWAARTKLRYEVKMGRVQKLPCQVCGLKEVAAHHPDYSKPLDVIWLCRPHHREAHGNKC